MWFFIASLVISVALALLTPKPRRADMKPAGMADFSLPTVSEARNIVLLFGTDIISGPNVITYGNLFSLPIEESSGGGIFGGGEDVIIGYQYYLDIDFSICWGEIDVLREIRFGDYVAWSGSVTGYTEFTVFNPFLFGGRDGAGGVASAVNYYPGTSTQNSDSYLNSRLGQQPGNRNVAHLVWRGGYIGNTQYIKPVSFKASRYPNPFGLTDNKHIIDDEANPACIIYELYTSDLFGKGLGTDLLDDASFNNAAETLYNEGLGLSLVLDTPEEIENLIGDILRHIDGSIYTDLSTGRINLRLVRDDYIIDDLPVLDDDIIQDVEDYTRGGIGSISTEVRLEYRDRSQGYKNRIFIQLEVGARHQIGYAKPVSLQYLGITSPSVISRVAKRELKPLTLTPASCVLLTNRNAYDLTPGAPFKMVWSPLGIEQIIMRVQEIDYGTLAQGLIRISCTEDVYALGAAIFDDNPSSGWVPIQGDPLNTDEAIFVDMNYFSNGADGTNYRVMVFAKSPRGDHIGYNLLESTVSDSQISVETRKYNEWLSLAASFDADLDAMIVNYNPSLQAKNVVEDNVLTKGYNMLILWSDDDTQEFVGYTSFVDNGDGTYTLSGVLRGLIDTTPLDWAADVTVLALDGGYGSNNLEDLSNGTSNFKIAGKTQSDIWDTNDVSTTEFTHFLERRTESPWPMGRFYTNGSEFTGDVVQTGDLNFTWAHREKTFGTLQKQDDSSGTLESGVSYTIDIYNEDGTLIHIESGLTGTSWTYTRVAMNSDNGGVSPYWVDVIAYAEDSGNGLDSLFPQRRRIYTDTIPANMVYRNLMTNNNTGYAGYTSRNIIPDKHLYNGASTIRVELTADSAGNVQIDEFWIGHPSDTGDAYDFDGNQVQITFNTGSPSVTVPAGTSVDSDDIVFSLDSSKDIIFSFYSPSTPGNQPWGAKTDAVHYVKLGNDASTEDASGYSTGVSDRGYIVSQIIDPTV